MEDVEKLLKSAMGEIERMLNTKTVVGEPMTIEGNTLIPLVSVGFGFGAGGGTGSGKMKSGEAGEGAGGGAMNGLRPGAPITVAGITLIPIERVRIDSGVLSRAWWLSAANERRPARER